MTFILEISQKKYDFKINKNSKLIVYMIFSKDDIDLSNESYFEFNNTKYDNKYLKQFDKNIPILKLMYF